MRGRGEEKELLLPSSAATNIEHFGKYSANEQEQMEQMIIFKK